MTREELDRKYGFTKNMDKLGIKKFMNFIITLLLDVSMIDKAEDSMINEVMNDFKSILNI